MAWCARGHFLLRKAGPTKTKKIDTEENVVDCACRATTRDERESVCGWDERGDGKDDGRDDDRGEREAEEHRRDPFVSRELGKRNRENG